MAYQETANMLVRKDLLKVGANLSDVAAIHRMAAEGATSFEISQKLLIKESVIASFMSVIGAREAEVGTELVESVTVEVPETARVSVLSPPDPPRTPRNKTFREVLNGKRK